ncbi:MAG: hypothetical protein IJQ73_11225 [Kiritimatiellae bacterium]|nr:hypothetical protein [Kiritimatiellia bacterium]
MRLFPAKVKGGFGLAAFALAATLHGGSKPPPPPEPTNKVETVIIVTPIGDGIYNTQQLKIDKETFDEMLAPLPQ